MALSDIRTQIRTLIGGVSGININNVHTYERLVQEESVFNNLYADKSLPGINGWCITRETAVENVTGLNRSLTEHSFIIKGFYRLNDGESSEEDFEALVEAVRDQLRTQVNTATANILGGYAFNVRPPQLRLFINTKQIFNTICHYAEILFPVQTRENL